ncbi:MAG TPA: hypothetical protein VK654_14600 [Nitrospirota bacterium]|nr:hypothetical protein [Nitrospirota bacterium]
MAKDFLKSNCFVLPLLVLALCVSAIFAPGSASAAGTPAGTIVTSTSAVTCQINGVAQGAVYGSTSFIVDRIITFVATKIADVTSTPSQTNAAVSFLVSNTSNTVLRFSLQAVSKTTNTWTANNVRIYRDDNNNGTWDAGDTLYTDAGTFGDIASDSTYTVMIVADIPAGASNGQTAAYDLLATAVDAGTLTVSVQTTGPNTAAVDTVFADAAGSASGDVVRDGKHSAAGTFTIVSSTINVSMSKTVTVIDQWGGSQPIPGATLRYTILVTANGGGTANNVSVTDPLPVNTTSIAGTLRLNGTPLTDAADADAGDVGQTTTNAVTVRLGNMTSATPNQTITFDVKIN